mmetsp:Transcript_32790/g.69187  ORF Transcript_32790/g.69187 Transcript_32790/m.69187 type:complete len:354 (-) Transcript_32790:86-1147(-)
MNYKDQKMMDHNNHTNSITTSETLAQISALRKQEDSLPCYGCTTTTNQNTPYPNSIITSNVRKAMIDWCFIVVDSFHLHRETVAIAASILDRYLGSNKGKSPKALCHKQTFQLASMASFYLAVKLHEPVKLGLDLVAGLSRGLYTEATIAQMERDILFSLDWRVFSSTPTPMEFVRLYLRLLPEWILRMEDDASRSILRHAQRYTEAAVADAYVSACRSSVVGLACLEGALNDLTEISMLEKEVLWNDLTDRLEFTYDDDANTDFTNEIRSVEWHLFHCYSSTSPLSLSNHKEFLHCHRGGCGENDSLGGGRSSSSSSSLNRSFVAGSSANEEKSPSSPISVNLTSNSSGSSR